MPSILPIKLLENGARKVVAGSYLYSLSSITLFQKLRTMFFKKKLPIDLFFLFLFVMTFCQSSKDPEGSSEKKSCNCCAPKLETVSTSAFSKIKRLLSTEGLEHKALYKKAEKLHKILDEPIKKDPKGLLKEYNKYISKINQLIDDKKLYSYGAKIDPLHYPEHREINMKGLKIRVKMHKIQVFYKLAEVMKEKEFEFVASQKGEDSLRIVAHVPSVMDRAGILLDGQAPKEDNSDLTISKEGFLKASKTQLFILKPSGDTTFFPVKGRIDR